MLGEALATAKLVVSTCAITDRGWVRWHYDRECTATRVREEVKGAQIHLQRFSIVRGKRKIKTSSVGIAGYDPRSNPRQIL